MGAPQSRLLEMAKGLEKRGWEVHIISAMPNYPTGKIFDNYKGKFQLTDTVSDLPVKRFWLYPSNSKRAIPRIISMLSFSVTSLFALKYLKTLKPDYIVVESPPLTLAYTALQLSRLTKSKFVMNVSDLWPLSALELGAISEGFLYRQAQKLEKFLYRNADLCLGQSQQIVDHLKENGAKRVHLFRNGVDSKRFKPLQFSNEFGYRKLKIVYAGLLGVAQNVLQICQEINFASKEIEFHIYGSGAQKEEIEQYLAHNKNKGITLHNPIGRADIENLLPTFDGTIIPLTRNIFGAVPSKIYEAMAAGLPIIFSGGGEGEKIIKNYELGWISAPGDMTVMAANLEEFKNQPEKRQKIKKNCIKAAREVFDRDIQIESLHKVLCGK